ncbi:bone morphogenetic protein 1-like [Babylonia areolata]|uniref:bone morphogenetic protein 1-like n=1 Tax=Babylonia areolata TaxID=304850 RepID=UPI003FD69F6B
MDTNNVCMLCSWLLLVPGSLPLVWGLPVGNSLAAEDPLSAKLLTIVQALKDRHDVNVLDYVLETNAGLGLNLFEGDIKGFNPRHRTAMRNPSALWTSRIVPYVIDSSVEAEVQVYIQEAMEEYHSKTCIRWVPRTSQPDYVVFTAKTGCHSMVGKSLSGGAQELSLMPPCAKRGTALHEMLHALGFFHEHSRPDRDQWVEVLLNNVRAGKERNFDRLPQDVADTLGVQYDYDSIMHYSRTAFSFNGQPTILPKRDPFANLGQRDGFSPRDVHKINTLYRCDLAIPDTETTQAHSNSQPTHVPVTMTPVDVTTPPPIGWTAWSTWSVCNMQCRHFRYRYCLNPDPAFCPGESQEFQTCAPPCQVAVSLGCWATGPSGHAAIPTVEGLYPQLNDSFRFRVAAVRRCADVATTLGHSVFALQDGGQCLTGPRAHSTFNTYGPSSLCGARGKGGTTAMNVYTFSTDTDGGWGVWTDWGQCSSSCGGGRKYRYRKCDSPPPVGKGQPCQGRDREVSTCNLDSCQVASNCGLKHHVGTPGTSGYIHVAAYQNYMNCEYVIQSGQDNVTISVTVTSMDIELSAGCIYDALTIYDGADDRKGQFLGAFCGHTPPPSLQSSGSTLFLRFSSDSTTTGAGFTLRYSVNSITRKACSTPRNPHHGSCFGSNFAGDAVVFSCDPGYHLVGQSEVRCVDQPGMAVWSHGFPVCSHGHRKRDAPSDAILRCSFEDNLCGFRHEAGDRWRWTVTTSNSSAPSQTQRPKSDRYGETSKGFLYVTSTRAWQPFDTARVTSPSLHVTTDPSSPLCLRFHYRLHGNHLVYLHVLQRAGGGDAVGRGRGSGEGELLWVAEGEEEGEWKGACVQLLQPRMLVQVTFEALLGQKLATSVAVDDVVIARGRCSG